MIGPFRAGQSWRLAKKSSNLKSHGDETCQRHNLSKEDPKNVQIP